MAGAAKELDALRQMRSRYGIGRRSNDLRAASAIAGTTP